MIKLIKSLQARDLPDFRETVKAEIEALNGNQLPLQQGLRHSSHAITELFSATVLSTSDDQEFLYVKAGIFYSGIIAGCNCADDPSPVDKLNEYCEIKLEICKTTAQARISLLD